MSIINNTKLYSPSQIDRRPYVGHGPPVAKNSKALGPLIGQRVARLMREKGLTDRDLAKLALVSYGTVHKLRHGFGGQAGVGTVANVARALGVSPAWLAYGVGPEKES